MFLVIQLCQYDFHCFLKLYIYLVKFVDWVSGFRIAKEYDWKKKGIKVDR